MIDQPVLRLVSVDLGASAEITTLAEVFDFAKDYLGLLKAAVIAAGIVPPGMEGSDQPLAELLAPAGRAGLRHRAGQPGQRHPQGLAPGRLDQPAGLPDRGLHAGHRPDPGADRPALRSGAAPGGRARDPGRVAGRLGRRLAGLGRRLAGHEADRGRGGASGRSRVSASAAGGCCPITRSLRATR